MLRSNKYRLRDASDRRIAEARIVFLDGIAVAPYQIIIFDSKQWEDLFPLDVLKTMESSSFFLTVKALPYPSQDLIWLGSRMASSVIPGWLPELLKRLSVEQVRKFYQQVGKFCFTVFSDWAIFFVRGVYTRWDSTFRFLGKESFINNFALQFGLDDVVVKFPFEMDEQAAMLMPNLKLSKLEDRDVCDTVVKRLNSLILPRDFDRQKLFIAFLKEKGSDLNLKFLLKGVKFRTKDQRFLIAEQVYFEEAAVVVPDLAVLDIDGYGSRVNQTWIRFFQSIGISKQAPKSRIESLLELSNDALVALNNPDIYGDLFLGSLNFKYVKVEVMRKAKKEWLCPLRLGWKYDYVYLDDVEFGPSASEAAILVTKSDKVRRVAKLCLNLCLRDQVSTFWIMERLHDKISSISNFEDAKREYLVWLDFLIARKIRNCGDFFVF